MPGGEIAVIADRDGSFFPFPKTRAERETAGDPRPSLVERYGTADGYRARLTAAADALIEQGLLQPEDATAILDRAAAVGF